MKRIICLLLALILALPVFAASAEEVVTSITPPESAGEYENVPFSNGYHGFCMDRDLAGTTNGNPFTVASSTDAASGVAQELKILFTQCFNDIFVSDGSGGYVLSAPNTILGVVYHFTNGQYVWGDQKTLADQVKAYTGEPIPDNGYQLTLDNGDTITFNFMILLPVNASASGKAFQPFFAYRISVSQPHEHDYSEDWKSDGENHWHECDCGDKTDLDEHNPIIVGDKEPGEFEEGYTGDKVCEDCGKELEKGQPIPPTHEHEYSEDWKSDDDEHWHECDCGDKKDEDEHNPIIVGDKEPGEFEEGYTGDTVCEDCGKELEKGQPIPPTHEHDYSEDWKSDEDEHWHECDCGDKKDEDEHNPVVVGKKDPTEFEEGYTGDKVCEDCGKELEKGQTVPATHEHKYADKWTTDKDNHWHECACGDKKDLGKHNFNAYSCSTCGIANPNYVSNVPDTADHNNPALWLMLSLLSLGACVWIAVHTRKNRKV